MLLAAFYDREVDRLYNYCIYRMRSKEDAEDVVSEAFVRFMKHDGLKHANPPAFLFSIARNLVIDNYRKTGRTVQLTHVYDMADQSGWDEDRAMRVYDVMQAMDSLGEEQQEVLMLHYIQDMDYASVAKAMNKSEVAVKTMSHRAIGVLKDKLALVGGGRNELPR